MRELAENKTATVHLPLTVVIQDWRVWGSTIIGERSWPKVFT